MLNEGITPYDKTVMGEISNWKRIEATIRDLSGPKVLEEREWLQLRLQEYERIVRQFRGTVSTRDERAWLIVASIERKRLEKALYPSMMARVIRRFKNALFERLDNGRKQEQGFDPVFNDVLFHQRDITSGRAQSTTPAENQQQDIFIKKPIGPDLSGRQEKKNDNGLHM
ncbi:hypothetical protein HF324_27755 [Chitinophaga oryzae]|uniref:Uncharacterized protein n=1 Tax=Chitinophaga oryzae TaxID=2725414 RepID=A0AAE7D9J0_9BACT|nr:hypothetical protein [Chitinophaga oryzae]QJB34921.1 hypothetical protein HF329_27895 [Chitinophaga oryzae]QJB41432.1 hypothetical protein HF324_27755 [Chitinophaga oryzae]